ncbi:hypothetical protein PROFUN_03386 [Planoprotostelium fungivorum]|uniref:Uncharacterized protein n=1 Tax=Planoprotostelium fungivorum TaxID=1890364 RepID=A0A2P6NWD2_9EUKA|nr:hypothetical protein PROFUN_03386 [Planoprotostelium fungivorum]
MLIGCRSMRRSAINFEIYTLDLSTFGGVFYSACNGQPMATNSRSEKYNPRHHEREATMLTAPFIRIWSVSLTTGFRGSAVSVHSSENRGVWNHQEMHQLNRSVCGSTSRDISSSKFYHLTFAENMPERLNDTTLDKIYRPQFVSIESFSRGQTKAMQSFFLLALLSLFAASQADVFIVTTYNSSSCTYATQSDSYPTGCFSNGPQSSQVTISGNTGSIKSFSGSSCSGTGSAGPSYTLNSVCTSKGDNTYYKAYTGRTFTPAPGPNDQITENYSGKNCSGTTSSTIVYNTACNATACTVDPTGTSSKVVCLAQGQAYSAFSSSGFTVAFSFGLIAFAAVVTFF